MAKKTGVPAPKSGKPKDTTKGAKPFLPAKGKRTKAPGK